MNPVYLDHNATTPVDERVLAAMMPFFSRKFGNASSKTHAYGWEAEEAVKAARKKTADLLGCLDQEIVFTSGSTEAVNIALRGVWDNYSSKKNMIVTVATEHKAVLDTCAWLEKKGAELVRVGVDREGQPDMNALEKAVDERTAFVAVMLANNETGVISDIKMISEMVHRKGSLLFCDTTQAAGKIPVKVDELGIDICCLSAHKMYGPKGSGAMYIRRKDPRVSIAPFILGGGHERCIRSGTLNVPGIVGLGEACRLAAEEMSSNLSRVRALRDRLEKELLSQGNVTVNGYGSPRLPNTSNLTISGVKADNLISKCSGIAIATGSACTSAIPEPSHVLIAMGRTKEEAYSSIRISLGKDTSDEDVDTALTLLLKAIRGLRKI